MRIAITLAVCTLFIVLSLLMVRLANRFMASGGIGSENNND